ncbi:hypothetical protein N1851_000302 [Merluccius polli]|uniref:Reverse transcriptase domain-containing protein n=1 Tax=Merluccius polli TaxID=89951 RepID=A0AA47NDS2_MERPO|nr:hypothetical protein N1851_000302 [Merluccius polli]
MCFVDLEKAFDHVPRGILWGVLMKYGVLGPLVQAIWALYNQSESCVGSELLPQVKEFKYLGILFTSEGKMEREMDRQALYRVVVVNRELSRKAKSPSLSTSQPSPMVMSFG